MSYHLPYRGLPGEILNMIFEHALYSPQGITIERHRPFEEYVEGQSKFKQTPLLALGLLRASREVSEIATPIFHRNNALVFLTNRHETLGFFQTQSLDKWARIRKVSLFGRSPTVHQRHNRGPFRALCATLFDSMKLERVDIGGFVEEFWTNNGAATPSDHVGLYDRAMAWAVLEAFTDGKIKEVGFPLAASLPEHLHIFEAICPITVSSYLVNGSYYHSRVNSALNPLFERDDPQYYRGMEELSEFMEKNYKRMGFTFEVEGNRVKGESPVVILREVADETTRSEDSELQGS
jgi:hypothetical protein